MKINILCTVKFLLIVFIGVVPLSINAQTTITAVGNSSQTLNWSSNSTWNLGRPPQAGEIVNIPTGLKVVLNQNADIKELYIDGTLTPDYTKDLTLSAEVIMVHGKFEWGTAANPYTKKAVITLKGSDKNASVMGMGTKIIGTMGSGILSFHGKVRYGWTMLNANAAAGSTSITLQDAVDWVAGEEMIITTTGREHDLDRKLSYTETEKRTITAVSADKKTITFSQALNYSHFGQLQTFSNGTKSWTLDERAEVGLLTRNIKIQGDASSEANMFGGQIMVMNGCKAYFSGVELYQMGQAGLLARYPFHWHMMGDITGQYFKQSSVHHSYQRAVTVHASQNATVEDNVIYDIRGHAIFLEDGNETGTNVVNNLISYVHKPEADKVIRPSDVFNMPSRIDGPAGIWVSHPTNNLVHNAVSSCGSGIWYALLDHPDGPSYDPNVRVNDKPLGNVDGNRTHGCYSGFIVDFADVADRARTEATHYHCPAGQVVKNATSFHCMRTLWWRGNYATFDNAMTANPYTHQGGNVFTFYGSFSNSLMVGHSANLTSSPDVMMYGTAMYDGNHEFVNTHFENFDKHNQALLTMIGGASKNLPATMQNCSKKNARVMHLSKTNEGNPEEQNTFASMIWDKTGEVLGAANKWAVLNHPFLTDDSFTKLDNLSDIGGSTTNKSFARMRFVIHDITEETKSTLYAEWSDGHQAHNRPLGPHWEVPVMVNSSRVYRFRMTDYTPNKMTISFGEARIGDKIKFFVEGFPQEMNVASHPEWPYDNGTALRRVYSQSDYNSATDNVYWWDGSKAWFQFIARYNNNERTENILITSPTGNQLDVANMDSRPYLGKRWAINDIVQAEAFDHGGQGVAYFEKKGNNYLTSGEFSNFDHLDSRMGEMVDLTKMTALSNNFYISGIKTNEWWNYSYTVSSAGTYTLKLSLSSAKAGNEVRVWVDNVAVGTKSFGSGDFSVQTLNLNLSQGNHIISIEALSDDFLFDWLSIQNSSNTAPYVTISSPSENEKITGNINVSATASNDGVTNGNGISSVVFNLKQNGTVKATSTDNSVAYTWALNTASYPNGLYELEVIAKNTSNKSTSKFIPVRIENPYDCAGVLNGTAFMDGCGKCAGGNTGLAVCMDTLWDKGYEIANWFAIKADLSASTTDQTVELTATGGNGHSWGPDYLYIDMDKYRYYHIRMKNNGSKTEGRISWWAFTDKGGNGGKSFPITNGDSDYKDYVVDLAGEANYYGLMKQTLIQASNGSTAGDKISIDRIEFSQIDRRDCNGVWRGTAYKDKCNTCVGGNTGKTSAAGCDTASVPNYWHFTSSLEGWNTLMNLSVASTANSIAELNVTAGDPYFHSPSNLGIAASDFKYVVIGMQNLTSATSGELFWVTTTSTNYEGAKRVGFPIVANDTKMRYYIIDLSATATWTGLINQIRLDPSTASSGKVKIDFIKFVGNYPNAIAAIPGTIQLEDFNKGGQGNAFYDTDASNNGNKYRTTEAVDIETCGDANGGYNVGWTSTGEWMEYLIKVPVATNYIITGRIAAATDGNQYSIEIDGEDKTGVVAVTKTAGLQSYSDFTSSTALTAGLHILRFNVVKSNGGFNLNSINIEVDPSTSTFEFSEESTVNVFPNPAADHLSILTSANKIGEGLEIKNALGQIVFQNTIQQNSSTINIGDLANGVYLITVGNSTQKIIISR
ncbi:MAG: carbohydrate-binding protein [Bacteroidetes bacterium]|nr:carbohydrate-binding protein [Bacteroidota bacterium]